MADTNGRVDPSHLASMYGTQVSWAIAGSLVAAANEFARRGLTFGLALPLGGYRPCAQQDAMRADFLAGIYWRYNLTPPPSPPPAPCGSSRHGFGLAVDVVSNASAATRTAIMKQFGFKLWSANDPNHYEPTWLNALQAPPASAFQGGPSTQIGGFLMGLSDGQQSQVLNALVEFPASGGAYYKTDAIIGILRSELGAKLDSIAAGNILFPGAGYLGFPAIANQNNSLIQAVNKLANGGTVDVEKLLAKNRDEIIAAQKANFDALTPLLKAATVEALSEVDGITDAEIESGVDKAIQKAFSKLSQA